MVEIRGWYNIFSIANRTGDAVCVTTNGIIKKDGTAVMGKGIALEADRRFNISARLGQYLKQYGNRAFNMGTYQNNGQTIALFTFPTKHDWKDLSDITLICKSAEEVMQMCDKFNIQRCFLPPPGCGCGGLSWEVTVSPWLSNILDDRFYVILPPE